MESNNILQRVSYKIPNYNNNKQNVDVQNKKNEQLLEMYLGENYESLRTNHVFKIIIEKHLKKIQYIMKTINSTKIPDYVSKILLPIFNKLIYPFISQQLKDKIKFNKADIIARYIQFFNNQKFLKKPNEIIALIQYQFLVLNYFKVYFIPLISDDHTYIHYEIHSVNSGYYKKDKNVRTFIKNYLSGFNITYTNSQKPERKKQFTSNDKEDVLIFEMLKKIFNNIIKKLQKLSQYKTEKDYKILSFGSYTAYNINKEVNYNDIDIYHSNPLTLLSSIMLLIKFILDIDIDVFHIPFILGHLSLRYKGEHFADCIYLDEITLKKIPTVRISEINFIDPIIQITNNFRMMSEFPRMSKVSDTNQKENSIEKMAVLLQYVCSTYNIDIKKDLFNINVDINFIDEQFFIINLQDLFIQHPLFSSLPQLKEFDYLIISRQNPQNFLNFLKNKNPVINRQYFALFNEIVAEFKNKPIEEKFSKKLNKKQIKMISPTLIDEEDIKVGVLKVTNFKEITTFINHNNVIFMSNFTTNCYLETTTNEIGVIKTSLITNITKETILSSFVMTQLLKHSSNNELKRFYILLLLSFVKDNSKTQEFEKIKKTTNKSHIEKFLKVKLPGNHEIFQISKNIYYKSIFFYKKQEKDQYVDYQEFLDTTMYNY